MTVWAGRPLTLVGRRHVTMEEGEDVRADIQLCSWRLLGVHGLPAYGVLENCSWSAHTSRLESVCIVRDE